MPVRILALSLPWIIGRNLAVILYYMVKGKGMTILRSKFDALVGVPSMLRKRRDIHQTVKDSDIMRFIRTWSDVGRQPDVDC